jgi:hypothetical protein
VVALLRVLGRSWLAAGLAAAAFAFGGFMTAQSVHLDLVQAAAWLPWAFVAVDRLAHRPPGRSVAPWVALLATALGLMILSGAVEPIFDGGIALALYAAWLAWVTPGRRRVEIVVGAVAGAVLGVALGAAQLLPGAAFQAQSQRAMHSFTFFTSGSMNKSLTLLGLDPFLVGGAHSFPFGFVGTFNLPEISSYIGILPVMGLVGLLARRHRRSPEAAQWWIWYAIVVVGLFLAWGSFTPVSHLVYDIPLFNRQRLLNRNLLEVDLALAVLFATWVDRMFTPLIGRSRPAAAAVVPKGQRIWWTSDVVLPLLPVVAVLGLQVVLLIGGPWFPHLMHVPGVVTRAATERLGLMLLIPSAIAVGAGLLVRYRARLGHRLPALLSAVVVADLLVFNLFIQYTPDPSAASSATAAPANQLAAAVTALGPGPAGELHRAGMFDPDRFYPIEQARIGQPDLTILRSLDIVQGYGAVVDEHYDAETGSHVQLNLTEAALSGPTFAQLDLGLLVTVPEYFIHLVGRPPGYRGSLRNGATALPPVPPNPSAPPDTAPPRPTPAADYGDAIAPAPTAMLAPGDMRTQFFGTVLDVTAVTVPLPAGDNGRLRIGLVPAHNGATVWLGPSRSVAGRSAVTFRAGTFRAGTGGVNAAGIVLQAGQATVTVDDAVVRTQGQGTYRVDGSLRDIMTAPRWRFVGTDDDFSIFTQSAAMGRAWVVGDRTASAHVVADTPWGAETIRVVTTKSATVVRSEQYGAGWHATVTDPDGATVARPPVDQYGLIQSVTVPAGVHLVHFTYRPARVDEGLALSSAAVIAVVLLALWPWARSRRRRRGRVSR